MPQERCWFLKVSVDRVDVPTLGQSLQVPAYRCALTVALRARLTAAASGVPGSGEPRVSPADLDERFGPDGEAARIPLCTQARCAAVCRDCYAAILSMWGLEDQDQPSVPAA